MTPNHAVTGLRSLHKTNSSTVAQIPIRPYPWKSRVAVPAAVVLAVIAVTGWSSRESVLPATDVRVTPVVLKPVSGYTPATTNSVAGSSPKEAATGGVVAQAAGWVEPDPYAVGVSALTDGIVREVLVLEGQHVKAGDVVARLIDDDAKLSVQKAEADVAAKQAELTAAQNEWDNPIERQRAVAASRAALDETRAEAAKIEADVAAENARAAEMEDLAVRLAKLVNVRAAAEQELISLRFKLDAQRATIKSTEARRPILDALILQKAAEVKAAEENARLRIAEARTLQAAKAAFMQAEAALREAKLRLYRTEVRSPAAGVVMTRMAEPGGKLMLAMDSPHSTYVARLFDPQKLQVRVDVPLADAFKIGVGTPAELTAEAIPGRTLRGEVTRVVNEADLTKNTLQFKVRIIDPPEGLKPEMLARVKFLAASRPGPSTASATMDAASGGHMPFVPERLVRHEDAGAFVTIADRSRGLAVRTKVTLADHTQSGWVAVTSGIAAGDAVIEQPADIADGTRIKIVGEAEEPARLDQPKSGANHGVH